VFYVSDSKQTEVVDERQNVVRFKKIDYSEKSIEINDLLELLPIACVLFFCYKCLHLCC